MLAITKSKVIWDKENRVARITQALTLYSDHGPWKHAGKKENK